MSLEFGIVGFWKAMENRNVENPTTSLLFGRAQRRTSPDSRQSPGGWASGRLPTPRHASSLTTLRFTELSYPCSATHGYLTMATLDC